MSGEIVGLESLSRKLGTLQDNVTDNLEVPVRAGLLIIENQAKRNIQNRGEHPMATGTLAASIHSVVKVNAKSVEGRTGTNAEYAKRHEFLPGHAILRPAYDQKKGEAKQEIYDALRDLIAGSI